MAARRQASLLPEHSFSRRSSWPGSAAWAQPKTDVVRLSNGDHVTGEIANLKLARLELKTDDAGTIEFEWDNIASVESTHQFEIGTTDDRRLLGSLQPGVGRVVRVVTQQRRRRCCRWPR